ncbi:MAG: cyclodeaminase/cyclohydrolase family protein, partial [Eubacterium sp.]
MNRNMEMNFKDKSCREFTEVLSGSDSVPGGGGASALAGAVGTALSRMVGSLTLGKKKYKEVEPEIRKAMDEAESLQNELLGLIERDAEVFSPLAAAYKLPKETEEEIAHKNEVMEKCLLDACMVP